MTAARAPSGWRSRTQSRDGIVSTPADFDKPVPLTRRLVLDMLLWGLAPPLVPGDTPFQTSMRRRDQLSLRVALWAGLLLAPGHTLIFGLLTPEPVWALLISVALHTPLTAEVCEGVLERP